MVVISRFGRSSLVVSRRGRVCLLISERRLYRLAPDASVSVPLRYIFTLFISCLKPSIGLGVSVIFELEYEYYIEPISYKNGTYLLTEYETEARLQCLVVVFRREDKDDDLISRLNNSDRFFYGP